MGTNAVTSTLCPHVKEQVNMNLADDGVPFPSNAYSQQEAQEFHTIAMQYCNFKTCFSARKLENTASHVVLSGAPRISQF